MVEAEKGAAVALVKIAGPARNCAFITDPVPFVQMAVIVIGIIKRMETTLAKEPINQMKRKLQWIGTGFVAVFALLQFTNPPRMNPPVVHDLLPTGSLPPEIAVLLHTACYDCHSHETRWPWYSHVAPMSWLIAGDVTGGRKHLNLSEWPADEPKRAAKLLGRMSDEIENCEMPPKKYTTIHANARLTDGERKELTDWLDAEVSRLNSMSGE